MTPTKATLQIQIDELQTERDQWRELTLKTLGISQRAATAAETLIDQRTELQQQVLMLSHTLTETLDELTEVAAERDYLLTKYARAMRQNYALDQVLKEYEEAYGLDDDDETT